MTNKKALLILGLVLVVVIILGGYSYLNKDNNFGNRDIEFEDLIPDDEINGNIITTGDNQIIRDPIEIEKINLTVLPIAVAHKEYRYYGNDIDLIILEFEMEDFKDDTLSEKLGYESLSNFDNKVIKINWQSIDIYYDKENGLENGGALYVWRYKRFYFHISNRNSGIPGKIIAEDIISKYKN